MRRITITAGLIFLFSFVIAATVHATKNKITDAELRGGSERFKDYTDEQLVLYGSKSGIGGPGESKVYGTAADPRYQIEMTRRLKEHMLLLNKNLLKTDSSITNMNDNISTVNNNIKTLDLHIQELDRGTTFYSKVLTFLTIIMAILAVVQIGLTIIQVRVTVKKPTEIKSSENEAQQINQGDGE